MKVGIKKVHENEWQVHIGCASIKMDRFSVELLNISLAHLMALEAGQVHSMLQSYIQLGKKMMQLDSNGLQLFLRGVKNEDLLTFLLVAQDEALNQIVLSNMGGILVKQLQADLLEGVIPEEERAKQAIQRLVERMFQLEGDGKVEFVDQSEVEYI